MNDHEINHRSLVLLGCLLAGLALSIPSLLLYNRLLTAAASAGLPVADWLQSLLGLIVALLPLTLLVRLAARRLDLQYPDSPDRKVPEPHERPSAHKLR